MFHFTNSLDWIRICEFGQKVIFYDMIYSVNMQTYIFLFVLLVHLTQCNIFFAFKFYQASICYCVIFWSNKYQRSLYVLHIWTYPAWGMMGPYASAHCFFANLGKKFSVGRWGIPLSLSGRLPNWVYCMYKRQRDPNWMYCMFETPKKREYSRNPTWDPPKVGWGPVLWCDSYPAEGDCGRHGVELRALKHVEDFSDSCQVMYFSSMKKKGWHSNNNRTT